jgi:hypothetical protein
MKKVILGVLAAGVIATISDGCTCARSEPTRWEYKLLVGKVGMDAADLQESVNKASAEGWEFVSISSYVEGRPLAVMRKPVK